MRIIDPSTPPATVPYSTLVDGDGLTAANGDHGRRMNSSQAYMYETNTIRSFAAADPVVKRVVDEVTFLAVAPPA